jgi:hypothetical protein
MPRLTVAFPEYQSLPFEKGRNEEMARLHLTAQKALPDHGPYGCSDDRSG